MIDIYADIEAAGLVVYQQGTAPAAENLPATFATVWQDYSGDTLHADNKAVQCRHEWTVIYYAKDTQTIYSGLRAVINALKQRGYLISGQGYDVATSWQGYDARAVDVVIIENLEA